MPAQRPIGYWLKLLDQLIEADLTRTLTPLGLNRRQWQILNIVGANGATREKIANELEAFIEDPDGVDDLLDELTGAGTLDYDDETYLLTASGIDRLGSARSEITAARQRISGGLTREAYDTTISTLETMCHNLGWTEES